MEEEKKLYLTKHYWIVHNEAHKNFSLMYNGVDSDYEDYKVCTYENDRDDLDCFKDDIEDMCKIYKPYKSSTTNPKTCNNYKKKMDRYLDIMNKINQFLKQINYETI